MSDPRAKAERSRAKDIRQGVRAQREHARAAKKARPFMAEVWYSRPLVMKPFWWHIGRYRTERVALEVIKLARRKFPWLTGPARINGIEVDA